MSREDYATHCAMASRATKDVVLKAMNSHRVLRDHVRKDHFSVTRCTVHPSHSLAERPPIVANIEHFYRHPEVTRYGDLLFLFDLAVKNNESPTRVPMAHVLVLARGSGSQERQRAHPAPLTHA
jgi:hypothetical protein